MKARHRRSGRIHTVSPEQCAAGCVHWHIHDTGGRGCTAITGDHFHNIYELLDQPTIPGQRSILDELP